MWPVTAIALLAGTPVGALLLAVLMRHQYAARTRGATTPLTADPDSEVTGPQAPQGDARVNL